MKKREGRRKGEKMEGKKRGRKGRIERITYMFTRAQRNTWKYTE